MAPTDAMFAHERRQEIVARARREGRVTVTDLAQALSVTTETIRRDLGQLESAGYVRRVYGGAISIERETLEPAVLERSLSMVAEKGAIARRALAEMPESGAVFLDAGTTTGALADLMTSAPGLTVVTHSLTIALTLAGRPGLDTLMLGGEVRGTTLATVGPWAAEQLRSLAVDVAFVATNGISVERGLTTPNHVEAQIKRLIVRSARRVVLLADHTKLGRDHFESFAALSDVELLITDAGFPVDREAELTAAGLRVERA